MTTRRTVCFVLLFVASLAGCRSHHSAQPAQPAQPVDDVFSIARDGLGLRNLTRSPKSAEQLVSVAPDGRSLAFFRHGKLVVLRGGRERTLGSGATGPVSAFGYTPAWSPDQRHIAFVRGVGCTEVDCVHYGLWVADVETGTQVRVARDGFSPAWLPDGRLTYDGDFRSFPSNPSGTEHDWWPTRFIVGRRHLRAGDGFAVPAPPGDLVAYIGGKANNTDGLLLMRIDGRQRRRITADPFAWLPQWSPDGKLLAFRCDYSGSLCVRDVRGRVLRREFGDVNNGVRAAWSRDGRFLAFVSVVRGSREIFVGNVATGRAHPVTQNNSARADIDSIGWAADGRIVFSGTGIPWR